MEKNTIIAIALAALVLISVVQALEIANVKSKITGSSVSSVSDSGGTDETYDQMMAEMHPDLYKAQQNTPSAGSPQRMVGGC